jgi:hypothetical protein
MPVAAAHRRLDGDAYALCGTMTLAEVRKWVRGLGYELQRFALRRAKVTQFFQNPLKRPGASSV